jgi:hypothetical protein
MRSGKGAEVSRGGSETTRIQNPQQQFEGRVWQEICRFFLHISLYGFAYLSFRMKKINK